MPWLLSEVKQEIKQMISSREILTGLSLFARDDYQLLLTMLNVLKQQHI
jgi:hypothetical protein